MQYALPSLRSKEPAQLFSSQDCDVAGHGNDEVEEAELNVLVEEIDIDVVLVEELEGVVDGERVGDVDVGVLVDEVREVDAVVDELVEVEDEIATITEPG